MCIRDRDSTVQPEWVKATAQKIQNGELVDNVIDVLVKNLSDLLNQILDHLSVSETLGITGWNNNEGCLLYTSGRVGAFTLLSIWIERPAPTVHYTEESITVG